MDFTTVERVKEYLGIGVGSSSPNTQDGMIGRLVTRASAQVARYCGRPFERRTVTSYLDGNGNDRVLLPWRPAISVVSVTLDGVAQSASADGIAAGYQLGEGVLYLFGGVFTRGRRNVVVTYDCGYTASETDTVPATTNPTLSPTTASGNDGSAFPITDLGVVYLATGAALTLVATAPAAGQYSFSGGTYTFNSTDSGTDVTVSYDYVPADVEQACIELVALKLKQRDNIGVSSKALAGESVTYTDRDMTRAVRGMLNEYVNRVPA